VFSPIKENNDPSLQEYLLKVESHIDNEFERRLAKAACNWLDPIRAYMHENGIKETTSPQEFVDAKMVKDLAVYVEFTDLIDFSTAKNKVFPELINNFTESTWEIMERLGVLEKTESSEVDSIIDEIFEAHQEELGKHRNGKKDMTGFFMGQVMRGGKIKANPQELKKLISEKLKI
jgi:aspartyl-tRNA(Asn)/glutamyl-tRNA(Gln) amidotransferase subunit B